MVGSRQWNSKKNPRPIRKRTKIDLEMKLKLISKYENGLGNMSAVAREFGLSVSTVNSIVKDAERIKEHVKRSALLKSTIITKHRAIAIDEMEKLLIIWIDEKMKNLIPLKLTTIQAKARHLYEKVKKEKCPDAPQTFMASKGWFNRFKNRAGFSVKICGGFVRGDTSNTNKMTSSLLENVNKNLFSMTNLNDKVRKEIPRDILLKSLKK